MRPELAGNIKDDPEFSLQGSGGRSYREVPKLYFLHIVRCKGVLDFNQYHLGGWTHGNAIITFARARRCRLYEVWKYLMLSRFNITKAHAVYDADRKADSIDLTGDAVIDLTEDE